jgi:hypothetical protein
MILYIIAAIFVFATTVTVIALVASYTRYGISSYTVRGWIGMPFAIAARTPFYLVFVTAHGVKWLAERALDFAHDVMCVIPKPKLTAEFNRVQRERAAQRMNERFRQG